MTNPPKARDHNAALIDPYGIYGTRTAHRLRNMRRRRRAQQFILVLIILGLVAVAIYSWQTHRVPSLSPSKIWPLLISPSAAPAWDSQFQMLLIPTQDGQIIATWPLAHPAHSTILLETDFPLHSTPLLDEKYFYVASENGILYALERGTGRRMWQYNSGASITTQPQLLGNLIFCGNDAGWLWALRAKTGQLVWKRKLPSAIGNGLAVVSNPAKLVLAPLTDGAAQRGGVWAMDANNGGVKWKFPPKGISDAQQITPPMTAMTDGKSRVFCANDTGAIINLNAANGKYGGHDDGWKKYFYNLKDASSRLLFRQVPLLDPSASPTRIFIVGNDDVVRCLDVYNGQLMWKWTAPATILGNVQIVNNQLLAPCRGPVSYLLNLDDGKVATKISGATQYSFAQFLSAGNNLWALDNRGTLQQFKLSNP